MPPTNLNPMRIKNRTFVVEVLDEAHREWTANANDTEGILRELGSAPPAAAITIYEWELAKAVNPSGDSPFAKYPYWRHVSTYPWVLRGEPDGD